MNSEWLTDTNVCIFLSVAFYCNEKKTYHRHKHHDNSLYFETQAVIMVLILFLLVSAYISYIRLD